MEIREKFEQWKRLAVDDPDLIPELEKMDDATIEDAFYRDLAFGTAGLRGVIGAGTNRMNIYVIRRTTQGVANYIKKHFKEEDRKVAIGYDSRIKSDVFAKATASIFAANGIKVNIYKQLMPVPCTSFATRELNCCVGVMVTASHNPSKYNGYKVYGGDGCQITAEAADEVIREIENIDPFNGVLLGNFDDLMAKGMIKFISEELITKFINRVKQESVLGDMKINKDIAIVYSPLHGAGLKPVTRILKESGFTNVTVVKEQEEPDGYFTTCPFPNPEIREAMSLGIEYAKKYNADLLMATDPDCDRIGIAVKDKKGDFQLLTGNQVGALLLDFICSVRKANGTFPEHPYFVKTIVTTDMAEAIGNYYGVKCYNVLTGFKYIGDVIANNLENNPEMTYILGFEESYGYLSGTYVRDKDAVDGAFLIAEMFAYYKSKNISLLDRLEALYEQFGYYLTTLDNYQFEGSSGFKKMQDIITVFKNDVTALGEYKIKEKLDYSKGINGLPKSDVVAFLLENGSRIIIRPSGTEPKLKLYGIIKGKDLSDANKVYESVKNIIQNYIK